MVICNVAVAAGPGQRGVNARWRLRVARQFVDAENSPSAALPLQRVEAPIILRDLVRVAEPSVEGHQDLAVHRVMADHDHDAAKAAPGNVSQPLDRPAGQTVTAARCLARAAAGTTPTGSPAWPTSFTCSCRW